MASLAHCAQGDKWATRTVRERASKLVGQARGNSGNEWALVNIVWELGGSGRGGGAGTGWHLNVLVWLVGRRPSWQV